MATISKLDTASKVYDLDEAEAEVRPDIFTSPLITTEDVIRELLAQGVPKDQILIPGLGKNDVLFMPDKFNDPMDEFEDAT